MTHQNALFEVTTKNGIVYTPNWAISSFVDDRYVEFAWCEIANDDHSFVDRYPRIRIDGESVEPEDHCYVYEIARNARAKELRKEFGEDSLHAAGKSFGTKSPRETADALVALYERSTAGEFVGQFRGNMMYLQEAAEVLGCELMELMEIVRQILAPEKRLSLNGMILWSWDEIEETRAYLERTFGHKDMLRSDFGGWSCHSCGKYGDEYGPSAGDVKCDANIDDMPKQ